MKKRSTPTPYGIALLAALSASTQAQEAGEDSVHALQEVVVSATRGERAAEDLPVSASVVSRAEIVNSPGRSVEELLRDVASVQLPADNSAYLFPLNPSIAIRGIGVGDTATRALVLLDGMPINGAFFGNVFWNRVPKDNTDRIEVVRGASSSLYGSYAMGGVVNMVTRVPSGREGEVDAQAGDDQTYQANLRYGDVFADKRVAVGLNANYFETGGYFRLPEDQRTPVQERLGGRFTNLQGRADVVLSNTVNGFFRVGYNDQNQFGGYHLQRQDTTVTDFASGLDIDLGRSGLVNLRAFYAHEHFDIANVATPDDVTSFVSNRHRINSDDTGLSAQWSKGFQGLVSRVSAGVDYRRIVGNDSQDIFNTPDTARASQVVGGGTQTSWGLFGEISLKPVDTVEVLGNLRFDHFQDNDGHIITDGVSQTFADRTLNIFSPRVAARWQSPSRLHCADRITRAFGHRRWRSSTAASGHQIFAACRTRT